MSPPVEESADPATGPMQALVVQQPAKDVTLNDLLKNGRVIALIASVLLGGPIGSAAMSSYTGADQTIAITEAAKADEKIVEAVEGIRVDVGGIKKQQAQLQIAINGDPTKGVAGIKGDLIQHQRKLESLRKAGKRRDRRRMKVEEKAGIKLPADYDLARGDDELWDVDSLSR